MTGLPRGRATTGPGFLKVGPHELMTLPSQSYSANGVVFLPAQSLGLAELHDRERGGTSVAIDLVRHGHALQIRLTPEGAQLLAERLTRLAARVERKLADQAAAAIEKARARS